MARMRTKAADLELQILKQFRQIVHKDCLRCVNAGFKRESMYNFDGDRFSAFCKLKSCKQAGWSIHGPLSSGPQVNKIRGMKATGVWVDEASRFDRERWDALPPRLDNDDDGEVLSLDDVLDAADQVMTPGAGSW